MKKILIFYIRLTIAVCAVSIAFIPMSVLAEEKEGGTYEFKGNGTKYDPYLISSYEDISGLRDIVDSGNNLEGKYFRQTADIVFPDGENWEPIGALMAGYEFAGLYDGNGHTLANIYCEDQYAGVFSFLAGEVRNLGIESGHFQGNCAGSITSHGTGTARIINCYNKADVYADGRAGGITDNYPGRIMFCWNFGNVTGVNEGVVTAGITSYGDADIAYCYVTNHDTLTDMRTFTGKVSNSFVINKEDIDFYMQQSYQDLFAVYSDAAEDEEGLINRGNTVFMVCENGEVFFDKEYEPEIFLAEKEAQKERFIEISEERYQFEGNGDEENPFLISTYDDLAHLRDCVDIGISYDGYYFEQTEDIYFPEGENWNPIGEMKVQKAFSGIYDGNGHCIYNIYCEDKCAGIFSYLDGEVRNLGIESGHFSGDCIGSITSHGTADARIINCYNKASVEGIYRAGGLVDNYPGQLLFSWNFGTVSGTKKDTILAGLCSYGLADIQHCYADGTIEVVNPATFQGTLYESGKIQNTDIDIRLKQNESAYKNYIKDETLKLDDMAFLRVSDSNELVFDRNYVLAGIEKWMGMGYIPEFFLIGVIVLLGIGASAVYLRYVKTQKTDRNVESGNGDIGDAAIQNKASRKEIEIRIVSVILTAVIFCVCFSYITKVLNLKTDEGILNLRRWEKAENEKTDILFLGASTITASIEIADLWEKYGIACYGLGAGGAAFYDDYYRLIEAEKSHHSDMVVVEVRAAAYLTDYAALDVWQKMNVSGLDMSVNKLNYINAAIEPELRLDYILTFPIYRGRYYNVTKWDFRDTSFLGEDDKGAWTIFYGNLYKPELICVDDIVEYRALHPKEEYYLKKIIEYCDANDINLLLLKTPEGNREYNQPFYNTVGMLAERYGVPYLDMNRFDKEIGLTESDFYEGGSHLNVAGARKCTVFFGDYLKANYSLTDHRGDTDYASWDRFAANREDIYLRAITDNTDYIAELARDHKKVIAVSYRLSEEKSEKYLGLIEELNTCNYNLYDKKDVLYGENNKIFLTLYDNNLSVVKNYSACRIDINGKTTISVDSPGLILVVYDDVMDKIVDVAAFTRASNFKLKHLYAGGEE